MPISPTVAQLGDLGFGGSALQQQQRDETEEEKRRRRLGLSAASDQSPTVRALLGGMAGMGGPNFNIGGMR